MNKTVKLAPSPPELLPSYSGKHLSLVLAVLLTMQTCKSEPNTVERDLLERVAIKPNVKMAPVTFSSVCCYFQSSVHITVWRGANWVWFALAASVWILHLSLSLSVHHWPGLLRACRVLVRRLSVGMFCARIFPLERQKSFAERLGTTLWWCVNLAGCLV